MNTGEVAKISKALADPTRLQIYEGIAANPGMYCGEIIEKHGLTAGTVSHHLRVLTEANLIECRREGQFVHTHALPRTMQDYTKALASIATPGKHKRERS
jgi:ArsR family transcriptional regulator, arsenate/arsenite/antimonite-responsive transcriptional repressor